MATTRSSEATTVLVDQLVDFHDDEMRCGFHRASREGCVATGNGSDHDHGGVPGHVHGHDHGWSDHVDDHDHLDGA